MTVLLSLPSGVSTMFCDRCDYSTPFTDDEGEMEVMYDHHIYAAHGLVCVTKTCAHNEPRFDSCAFLDCDCRW